jgi:hypothetical protein
VVYGRKELGVDSALVHLTQGLDEFRLNLHEHGLLFLEFMCKILIQPHMLFDNNKQELENEDSAQT